MIRTRRLLLFPLPAGAIEAWLHGRPEFEAMLRVTAPEGWPVYPESLAFGHVLLGEDAAQEGWVNWLFVRAEDRVIVGDGGFKGRPDAAGQTEIGYAIVPAFRRQGYASEAAEGLVRWAFSNEEVTAVRAETQAEGQASINVLTGIGMAFESNYTDPEDGELSRWVLTREKWEALRKL